MHKNMNLFLLVFLLILCVYISVVNTSGPSCAEVVASAVTPISDRTAAVRDAIVAAVPGVVDASDITVEQLAAITSLNLRNAGIKALKAGDFSGLVGLTNLNLFNNELSGLPSGIFEGLSSLTTLRLGGNAVDPLPLSVSLEKVAEGEFKAVAATGASFDFVLPLTVSNGSVKKGGGDALTIPHGRTESGILTVARTVGTRAAVTVDIGSLPGLPNNHYGYALVKSDTGPLTVIAGLNAAPIFTDGTTATRAIAENTDASVNIGTPIAATDADGDTLTYTLSGTDADALIVDSTDGQLQTKAELDYENRASYSVIVSVFDGRGGTDSITVTINVIDVDEVVPVDTLNTAPTFIEGVRTVRAVVENVAIGTSIGVPVFATDAEDDTLAWMLGGVDAAAFDIDSAIGQLKTKVPLDYETMGAYSVTLTVSDGKLSDTIRVIIRVIEVSDTVIAVGVVPVVDRTPAVRDAIVAAVPGIIDAVQVTETHLASITHLNLRMEGITSLKIGDFSGLVGLTSLNLHGNQLSGLPPGIFDGLTQLAKVRLGGNAVDPMLLFVGLQQVDVSEFRVVIPIGAPFDMLLPIRVENGHLLDDVSIVKIPVGHTSSDSFIVRGTGGATVNPTVHISALPSLPLGHYGYMFSLSEVCKRTPEVAAALTESLGVEDCNVVTEVDLAWVRTLDLSGQDLRVLRSDDFSGLYSLQRLLLADNALVSLPAGIFEGLGELRELHLSGNPVDFALPVFLEKVGASEFKAVLPHGAPFPLRLMIRIRNGEVADTGVTEPVVTIPQGVTESLPLTITRTVGTWDAVTAAIVLPLPMIPETHTGYSFVPSKQLPLEVLAAINNPPIFTEGIDTIRTVAENMKAGTDIGDPVTVTDVDRENTLTYILGGPDADTFNVDSATGQLKTKAELDYETKTSYAVTVTVSDGILTDSISVTINVTDVEEEEAPENRAPAFDDDNTTLSVAEKTRSGADIGVAVSATDPDADPLSYSLGGIDGVSFSIDSSSGQIRTSSPLDYETKTSYTVTLSVSDGSLSDSITVTVNVTDVNEAPQFADSTTTRSIAENTASDTNIGAAVSATDPDIGDNLTYTLGGTDAASFSINSTNGQLRTKAALDYATKNSYVVTISVSDGILTDSITVTINVTDVVEVVENRAPVFTAPVFIAPVFTAPVFTDGTSTIRSIVENTASDTNIGAAVSATDPDIGDNLTYTLGGTDAASFSINSTNGQLRTKAALDYETKNSYVVTISVSDGILTDSITVTISVTDVNEAPEFASSTTTRSIAENTAANTNIGAAVSATDPDTADTLTYTLGGTDAASFGIDSTTGQLRTKVALDYAIKNSYVVTISVSDGSLSDSITVTINVTEVVENRAPVFTDGTSTTRSIAENTASDTNIGAAVSATDPDTADNLIYTLGGTDASSFSIDSTTGQLKTKVALDYETKNSYVVTISVSDGSLSDSITVTISVTEVNEAPEFASSTTTRSIAENTAANTNIGSPIAAATDVDSPQLTYTLGGTDAASFDFDKATRQLKTKSALDYETKNSYVVTISVSDGSLSDSITVTISVTDVNEAPRFASSTTTRSIAENTAANTNIGAAVSATDPDTADTLTYTLGGTDAASFGIDSTTGQLRTKVALDYAIKNSYVVTISVSDGSLSDSITVTINVTEVVENRAPVFTDGTSTTRSIAENTASDTNIGAAVSATDPDTADNLIYTLGGTDASSFSIDSTTGQLKTKVALDYETKNSYVVTISVSDGSLSDSITVTISVTDVNEAPEFASSTTTRSIAENTAANTNIGSPIAAATDVDSPQLTYTLGGTDAASFDFDKATRQLKTKSALDYETKNSYVVTISVSDGILTDSITVTISVTDVNEAPEFASSTTTRSIAENTAANTNIGAAVSATDPDTADTLTYTLGGTDAASFGIDSTTGQLRTKVALDYAIKNSYVVTISVSDGSLSDSITVTINVTEVVENRAPVFTDGTSTTRSIAENTASDTNIGAAVSATDPDTADNLIYTLGGTDASSFSIDSTTGQLKTKVALDYETKNSYVVTISVSDGSLSDSITVTISVTDVNEAPEFASSTTTRSIAENTAANTNIGSPIAAATDVDSPQLTYTLGGTDAASFDFDKATRQLKTKSALDYETKNSYVVTISVSDGSLSDSITVTISVTDVNEAPRFASSTTTRSIADKMMASDTDIVEDAHVEKAPVENTPSGINIGDPVSATDPDTADTLMYALVEGMNGTDASSFSIDSTNGQLLTKAALDHETKNSYTVIILVSDGRGGTDSITVTINVTSPVTINITELDETPSNVDPESTEDDTPRNRGNIAQCADLDNANEDQITDVTSSNVDPESTEDDTPRNRGNIAQCADPRNDPRNDNEDQTPSNTPPDIPLNIDVSEVQITPVPVKDRSQKVKNAILRAVPDVNKARDVTEEHLASITTLEVNRAGTSLQSGDFSGLTSLQTLDLSNNKLGGRSIGTDDPDNVDVEDVDWLVVDLPSDIFNGLTSLQTLDLSKNFLQSLPSLSGLTSLQTLDLSKNFLQSLPSLSGLTSLQTLDLSGNIFESLPSSSFSGLTSLQTLNLVDNELTGLPKGIFDGLTSLKKVPLMHNCMTKATFNSIKEEYPHIEFGSRGKNLCKFDDEGEAPSAIVVHKSTSLFPNYPNPFNPETWIPYQLSKPALVTLTIYDVHGVVVRKLDLGMKAVGVYISRNRAAHWDGKNQHGEFVASGLYFYTLRAGDFVATRKLLIRK